jgi:hypothetical protein
MKAKEPGSHRRSQIHVSPDGGFDIAQPVFIHFSIPINAFNDFRRRENQLGC